MNEIDQIDNEKNNCLHWAIKIKNLDFIKIIIKKNFKLIYEKNIDGITPY